MSSSNLDRDAAATRVDLVRPGLLLAWLFVVLLGGTWAVISSFGIRLMAQALLVALVGGWICVQAMRRRKLAPTGLEPALAGLLFAATLSTVFSINPRLSGEVLLLYAGYAGLFFVLVALASRRSRDIVGLLIAASVTLTVASLVEPILWYFGLAPGLGYQISWPSVAPRGALLPPAWPRPGFVTGNPNVLAGLLAPWLPVAVHMVINARGRSSRLTAILWLFLLALAIISTVSRGGFLAAVGGLVFWGLLRLALVHRGFLAMQFAGWRIRATVALTAVGLASATMWRLLPNAGLEAGSAGVRVELWLYALRMFWERPFLGYGPDSFGLALLQFRSVSGRTEDFLPHAHNLYLGILAETGIIGLMAALWFGISIWRRWWSRAGTAASGTSTANLTSALMAGLVAMALHGLVEDFRIYPALVVQGIAFVALVVAGERLAPPAPRGLPARWLIAPAVLLLMAAGYTSFTRWEVESAARYAGTGQWLAAQQALSSAAQHDPAVTLYLAQSALLEGVLASRGDAAADQAIAEYRETIAAEPRYASNHANLATLLWNNGDRRAAIAELERAVSLQPNEVRFRFNLAIYLREQGDHTAANQQFAQLIRTSPGILSTSAWQEHVSKAAQDALVAKVLDEQDGDPEAVRLITRGRIALAAGDLALAKRDFVAYTTLHAGEYRGWRDLGLALAQHGQLDEAKTAMRQAVTLVPDRAETRADLAAVLYEAGDRASAGQEAAIALFIQPNPKAHIVLARLARQDARDADVRLHYEAALPRRTFDLTYSYSAWRRPGIPLDSLPQLIAISEQNAGAAFEEYASYLMEQGDGAAAGAVLDSWAAYDPSETSMRRASTLLPLSFP